LGNRELLWMQPVAGLFHSRVRKAYTVRHVLSERSAANTYLRPRHRLHLRHRRDSIRNTPLKAMPPEHAEIKIATMKLAHAKAHLAQMTQGAMATGGASGADYQTMSAATRPTLTAGAQRRIDESRSVGRGVTNPQSRAGRGSAPLLGLKGSSSRTLRRSAGGNAREVPQSGSCPHG
jgi:hypothetical protein